MLVCYRTRRRIGAYLDGALRARASLAAASHIAGCSRCHAEAEALRRLHGALTAALGPPPPAEWTGFWEGVVRGIERGGARSWRPSRSVAAWGLRPWLRLRLALGGALAVGAIGGITVWGTLGGPWAPESAVVVSAATTEHPAATVMVYTPPERDLAVVWVFDPD